MDDDQAANEITQRVGQTQEDGKVMSEYRHTYYFIVIVIIHLYIGLGSCCICMVFAGYSIYC